jgi:hypothetical protein
VAARRLLIVLLILLGLSTLAAALIPQRSLEDRGTTTTRTAPTTTMAPKVETVPPEIAITVGPKRLPLVRARLGDQFTLLVTSTKPRELSIPEFGLLAFATATTPARFELLPTNTGKFGILFAATGKPAGQIEVTEHPPKQGGKGKAKPKGARSRAPAGSDQA